MIRKGTKKFGKHYYKHGYTVSSKSEANAKKQLLRKQGHKVRTNKLKKSYEVYYY